VSILDLEVPWTGERLVTGCAKTLYGVTEHLHRYGIALEFARGKRVLDIACGEGYGAALLSRTAASVVGVDTDAAVIQHASTKYAEANLTFRHGRCESIPLPDCSVDLVVSFETLEHFAEHDQFIKEVKRVLDPGGVLLLSTPNRPVFSGAKGITWEFHVKELDCGELQSLLEPNFRNVAFYHQALVYGSYMAPAPGAAVSKHGVFTGDYFGVAFGSKPPAARFFLTVCSDTSLTGVPISIFECALPEGRDATDIVVPYSPSLQRQGRLRDSVRQLFRALLDIAILLVGRIAAPALRNAQNSK
jgi:2-polyprenyl-3-methyl-5-hydroxy-6-metoxy-1,4-benzoquinol methylase